VADTPKRDWLDKLAFPFVFTAGFGTYLLFFKGPAANGAQLAFRIGLFAVGMVGSLIIFVFKAMR
jgi:hypothetical protein